MYQSVFIPFICILNRPNKNRLK